MLITLWLFGKEVMSVQVAADPQAEPATPEVVTRSVGFAAAELAETYDGEAVHVRR